MDDDQQSADRLAEILAEAKGREYPDSGVAFRVPTRPDLSLTFGDLRTLARRPSRETVEDFGIALANDIGATEPLFVIDRIIKAKVKAMFGEKT